METIVSKLSSLAIQTSRQSTGRSSLHHSTDLNGNEQMTSSVHHKRGYNTKSTSEEDSAAITIEELADFGDKALGLKVIVNSQKHSTIGVISYILPDCKRLALEKASNPLTGKVHPGLVIYLFFEVLSISIVGEDKETRKHLLKYLYNEEQKGKRLLMKKLVPMHLLNNDGQYDTNVVDEDILLGKTAPPLSSKSSPDISKKMIPPPSPGVSRPSKWITINNIDEAFNKAIVVIKSEKVIGLSAKGRKIGRAGDLAWISIATSSIIFLFDLAAISTDAALSNGLEDVLLDQAIVKVVHDCRYLEDFLHHVQKINLQNVFDTQAGEIYVHMVNNPGTSPSFVSGLSTLLVKHIGLSPHHLYFSHVREECFEDDEMIWFERPLHDRLCEELAQSVMYLVELRTALLCLILVDLSQVTNIFLGSLRDKDSATYKMIEPQVVPCEVQRLAKKSVNNHIDLHDPYITFSRDSFRIVGKKKQVTFLFKLCK